MCFWGGTFGVRQRVIEMIRKTTLSLLSEGSPTGPLGGRSGTPNHRCVKATPKKGVERLFCLPQDIEDGLFGSGYVQTRFTTLSGLMRMSWWR